MCINIVLLLFPWILISHLFPGALGFVSVFKALDSWGREKKEEKEGEKEKKGRRKGWRKEGLSWESCHGTQDLLGGLETST